MRLYPKKLHSIEELKREKAALMLRRDQADIEELFSFDGVMPSLPSFGKKNKKESKKEKEQTEETAGDGVLGMLSGLLGVVDISDIFKIVAKPVEAFAGKKIRNKVIIPVAKELLGGYLKWKAAELGFKAAKHFVQKRKEKKQEEQEKD